MSNNDTCILRSDSLVLCFDNNCLYLYVVLSDVFNCVCENLGRGTTSDIFLKSSCDNLN